MAVILSYEKIMEALASNPTFILTTMDEPKTVKTKLSQAKHRLGIKGKLSFTHSKVMAGPLNSIEANRIEIALLPSKEPSVTVLSVGLGDI